MRIVAGTYGGRQLQVPKGRDIRPTSDKVRGAIFNALEARGAVDGARVLDAFCGTGALGLEALSRGADACTFWDKDKGSLALARANAESLGVVGQCGFQMGDAVKLSGGEHAGEYDLVFLDPPYRKGLIEIVLQRLVESECLRDGAVCALEMEKGYDPKLDGSFSVQSDKIYGDSRVFIVSYEG